MHQYAQLAEIGVFAAAGAITPVFTLPQNCILITNMVSLPYPASWIDDRARVAAMNATITALTCSSVAQTVQMARQFFIDEFRLLYGLNQEARLSAALKEIDRVGALTVAVYPPDLWYAMVHKPITLGPVISGLAIASTTTLSAAAAPSYQVPLSSPMMLPQASVPMQVAQLIPRAGLSSPQPTVFMARPPPTYRIGRGVTGASVLPGGDITPTLPPRPFAIPTLQISGGDSSGQQESGNYRGGFNALHWQNQSQRNRGRGRGWWQHENRGEDTQS